MVASDRAPELRDGHYRALIEKQVELISLARSDGTLVFANRTYAKFFGRSAAQLVGQNLFELVAPADVAMVRGRIAHVLETGEDGSGENRLLASDGSERWISWTNSRQVDDAGEVLLHSCGRDVTEQRAAQVALQDAHSFMRRISRAARVGGWQLDLRSGTLTWSDETRRIHEVGPDYVPSLDSAILFYAPEARPVVAAAVEDGIRSGAPWDLELPFDTAKGRRIWVRAVGEAEFEDGQAVRLVGAFQDITERRGLEKRLADNERFLRQLTDTLPIRIAYLDSARRYQFVNETLCRSLGLPREEILGRTRKELLGPGSDDAIAPRALMALAGNPQQFEFEEDVAGQQRRIENRLVPDFAESGEVRGFFVAGVDVTEESANKRALKELAEIIENTADLVVQTDRHGSITYLNPVAQRLVGGAGTAGASKRFAEFYDPKTRDYLVEKIIPKLETDGIWVGETTIIASAGLRLPVSQLIIAHRDDRGRVARYSTVMRDISEQVDAQRRLQRQAVTLQSITERIPAVVAVVGADFCYRFVNGAFEKWVGKPRELIVGRAIRDIIGTADFERSRPHLEAALKGQTVEFEREYTVGGKAQTLSVTYVPLPGDDGAIDSIVAMLSDISLHREEQSRLKLLSQADSLTGLLNRAGFEEALDQQLRAGGGPSLALLYVDLDHFKPVNDRYGHAIGDEVLKLFAQRLRSLLRPTDTIARLGGDEFALLLPGVRERAHAEMVSEKVIAAAAATFEIGTLRVTVGASAGVAFGAAGIGSGRELIARADAMLYRAKEQGRGRQAGEAGVEFQLAREPY